MSTKSRPSTRELTAADRARMAAAREAIAKGESIKPIAFGGLASKADKAAYLRAHL